MAIYVEGYAIEHSRHARLARELHLPHSNLAAGAVAVIYTGEAGMSDAVAAARAAVVEVLQGAPGGMAAWLALLAAEKAAELVT